MKRYLITAILLSTIWINATAQDDPYHGGSADGHSMSELINSNFATPTSFQPYKGGNGDGYDGEELINSYFNSPIAAQPYLGGSGDGYDGDEMLNSYFNNAIAFQPYKGGDGDGYDMDEPPTNQQLPFPTQFTAYLGGANDGWTGYLIPNVSILPIHLLNFDGEIVKEGNLLQWKVAATKGKQEFQLQKSAEGKMFTTIDTKIENAATDFEKSYSYLDTKPFEGDNYYRLALTDEKQERSYSHVVLLVYKKEEQSLSIYPNPAQQILNLEYKINAKGMMRVLDLKGSLITSQSLQEGNHKITIPLENLAQGMYMLQVVSESGINKSLRFIKQ